MSQSTFLNSVLSECFNDGEFRVFNRTFENGPGSRSSFAGRIEVCVNRTYGSVCDEYWDNRDAMAYCRNEGRSLGFGKLEGVGRGYTYNI